MPQRADQDRNEHFLALLNTHVETYLDRMKGATPRVTKTALAAALGVERTALYKWLNGTNTIPPATLDTLCTIVGLTADQRAALLADYDGALLLMPTATTASPVATPTTASCFISYSTKDEEFVQRLHARMQAEQVPVWFAPQDMAGGAKLYEQITHAIQRHDKLLLVLSAHSIQSAWVMTEIRSARKQERQDQRRKLFPIRLVDMATLREWECFDADSGTDLAVEVREYFIPDFSQWSDPTAFEIAVARLLRDLRTAGTT